MYTKLYPAILTLMLLLCGCGTSINNLDANEIFTKSDPLFKWTGTVKRSDNAAAIPGVTVQVTYILDISDIEEPKSGDDEPNTIRQVWNDETNDKGEYFINYRWNKYARYTVEVLDVQPRSPASFLEYTTILKSDQDDDFHLGNLAAGTPLTWSGVVKNGSDKGIVNAVVTVHTLNSAGAALSESIDLTDSNGSYSIPFYWDEAYRYKITVRLDGSPGPQRTEIRGAIEEIDQVDNFEIIAPTTFKWRGKVTRIGSPTTGVANALLVVTAENGSDFVTFGPRATEASGNYEIDVEWRPDWAYSIEVSGPGGGAVLASRSRGVISNPGSAGLTDDFSILLEQSFTCSGKVSFDSAGSPPIPGAIVRMSAPASSDAPEPFEVIDVTDTTGAYSMEFEWTPERSYSIAVTLPGESSAEPARVLGKIVAANRTEDFSFPAVQEFHWRGVVEDPAGEPQLNALLTLTTSNGSEVVSQLSDTTAEDGAYDILFEWRPEYSYVITMSSAGEIVYSETRDKGHIGMQDQQDDFVLLSPPLLTWSGTVSDGGGPLENATVIVNAQLSGGTTYSGETSTDMDGKYTIQFPWNESFSYSIAVRRPGQSSIALLVQRGEIPMENQVDDFVLPAAGLFTWSGKVNNLTAQPIDQATVILTAKLADAEVYTAQDTTAVDGLYSIDFPWQADYEFSIGVKLNGQTDYVVLIEHGQITADNRVENFNVPGS